MEVIHQLFNYINVDIDTNAWSQWIICSVLAEKERWCHYWRRIAIRKSIIWLIDRWWKQKEEGEEGESNWWRKGRRGQTEPFGDSPQTSAACGPQPVCWQRTRDCATLQGQVRYSFISTHYDIADAVTIRKIGQNLKNLQIP